MVDEGLSGSLDWSLQSLQYNTPTRTLGIILILLERQNEEVVDKEEHQDDIDTIRMKEDKVALITESEIWNKGDFRKNIYQYGTGYLKIISFWYYSVFNSCNFLSFVTALLENGPWRIETSCSNKHLAVKEVFEIRF